MNGGRQLDCQLDWLVIGDCSELQLRHIASSRAVGFEDEIVGDHHAHQKTRSDCDRRLDVERTADHLLTGLVDALRHPLLNGSGQRAVIVAAHASLRSDAQDSREDCCLEQHAPMVVDLVLQPCIALGIGARLALQHDRLAVGHD